MKSEPGIVNDESKKTRSWHPGSPERPRNAPGKTRSSSGKSGFPAEARYWGRVNTRGEFEHASGFPRPPALPFRLPWRGLWVVVRGLLPSAVAAFVGAVTALSWQTIMIKPQAPAVTAIVQPAIPVGPPVVAAPVAVSPVAAPAAPVIDAIPKAPVVLPAKPPTQARPVAVSKPRVAARRAAPTSNRASMPARPTSRQAAIDEDGILEPTF